MSDTSNSCVETAAATANVLITGGTGFIGTPLVAALRGAGYGVAVLSRDVVRAQRQLGPEVLCIDSVEQLPWTPTALINLAGAGIADRPWSATRRRLLRASRIEFTRDLLAALGPERLPATIISASAVGYYGDSGAAWVDERTPCGDGFAAALCRDWEHAALQAVSSRVVLLRIGLVLGPGGLLQRLRLPFSLGLGGRLGDGRQYMPWVHRDDVIGSVLHLLEHADQRGPFNVVAPQPVTNSEFTQELGTALRRPTVLPLPGVVLRTLLGDMGRELLLGGQRVSAERIRGAGYAFRFESLPAALGDLL